MLSIPQIDIKTGQTLTEMNADGNVQVKQKEIEHSYLEHWLTHHDTEQPQFWVGKFYGNKDSNSTADQQRLEAEGKYLVFTNGKDGYFADRQTAQLLTEGDVDRCIQPLFTNNVHSPHYHVAYGSLIPSDGMISTSISAARILVIDDETRSHGNGLLQDAQGRVIPLAQVEKLYDKMGDGTMLISSDLMEKLIQPEERESITQQVFEQAGIDSTLSSLTQDNATVTNLLPEIDRQVDRLIHRTVSQFRAATADLPSMIKGTMTTSEWCDRLGVDAIVSTNDIKGDDGRLSAPGIKTLSHFWLNRKSDGQYNEQRVGAQVKGCIPEATLHEFNPRIKAEAEALAAVAADPEKLLQHYIAQKDQHQNVQLEESDGEPTQAPKPPDWMRTIGKADRFGILTGFNKINYELERYLRGERVDLAIRGIYVPSAMAQHHSQLKPWEVCNKELPHGAIVAYYRSPFPNVSAGAIAINNTHILKEQDPEAYRKSGVAYLPPWTAKHIAITDFDKDANGFFVGYLPQIPDLPERIRQHLADSYKQTSAEQYEAGRSHFSEMITRMQEQSLIQPGEYPLAVKEFIDRNAPNCKPPEIAKQPKVKHPWHEGESRTTATWRAWERTADNPIGKVANVGMILQSLALETQYCPEDKKETLLQAISLNYRQLLAKGRLNQNAYFPEIQDDLKAIAQSSHELTQLTDPEERQAFIQTRLNQTHDLLAAIAQGANAENLQTAVDSAKSAQGIDEEIHQLAQALAYKPHLLRQNQKDPTVYLRGKIMPTNTEEPIGWAVEQANQLYQDSQLPELDNKTFRELLPKTATPQQEADAMKIAKHYNRLIKSAVMARDRLQQKRPEDEQPTLTVTDGSERSLVIQRLCDADPQGITSIWRANGEYPDWLIRLERNSRISEQNPEKIVASLVYLDETGVEQRRKIGYVSVESTQQHELEKRLRDKGSLVIRSPHLTLNVPYALQNDVDEQLSGAARYLQDAIAQIPMIERMAYASALWHHSEGMGIVLRGFAPEICQQLQQVPDITLRGIQRPTNEAGQIPNGEYIVRFSEYSYTSDYSGKNNTSPSIAIVQEDGTEKQFGAIADTSMRMPEGSLARVAIETMASGKIAKMQVLEKLDELPQFNLDRSPPVDPPPDIKGKPIPMVFPLKLHGEENLLPVDTCIEAMRGYGRCHTTRAYEPYRAYGFRAGDLAIAQSGARQVVFRVGEQYRITPEMIADPDYQKQWATMEKHSAKELQTFRNSASVWGLKMEPLGDYVDRHIVPFTPERYALSSREARGWYMAASLRNDPALAQQVMAIGTALQQHYNQEQGGAGQMKPPGDYTHAAVTISVEERRQMRHDLKFLQRAMAQYQVSEQRSEVAL
jgi:hypothetical protein